MKVHLEQQTEEWLHMRRNKIGASDAPIIMKVSPWKTSYELWLDKLGLSTNYTSYSMQRGIELESQARENFEKLIGIKVSPQIIINDERPWQMASLDGLSDDNQVLVEIKCPGAEDHHTAKIGEIPGKYIPQLQHQMSVCNLQEMFYYSYDGKNGCLVNVKRDANYINNLLEKELEFWGCMQNFTPPELERRDYVEQASQDWKDLCVQWNQLQANKKGLELQESNLKEKFISMCNGKNTRGSSVKVMKTLRKGNVDYTQIPELENIDLEAYRKPHTEYWKICGAKE